MNRITHKRMKFAIIESLIRKIEVSWTFKEPRSEAGLKPMNIDYQLLSN